MSSRSGMRTMVLGFLLLAAAGVRADGGFEGTIDAQIMALGSGRVCLFAPDGSVVRSAPTGNNADAWLLPNGNFLFADGTVKEVDPQGKVVFEYRPPNQKGGGAYSCQRLANGVTLVGENGSGRVVEVDAAGKVVFEMQTRIVTKNDHHRMRMCRKLANGNYLVCHSGDHIVREYTPQGETAWEHRFANIAFAAVRLPNGNTMASSLDQVSEVSPTGEIVWEFKKDELPACAIRNMTGIQVLKNGNLVVGCYGAYDKGKDGAGTGMFEITRAKKLVWRYVSPGRRDKSMMAVQKLEGDAVPLR